MQKVCYVLYKECYLVRILLFTLNQDAYCKAYLFWLLVSWLEEGTAFLLLCLLHRCAFYFLLYFTVILHIHIWWQSSSGRSFTKHLDILLCTKSFWILGKMNIMKQLRMRSKHVRIELEYKHSAFPAAICKTLF